MSAKMLCLIVILIALQQMGTVPTEDLSSMEPTNPEFIGTVTPREPEGGHYYVPEEDDVSDSKVRSEKIVESIVSNNMEQYPTHNFLNEQQAKQLIDSNITAKAAYIAINSILSKKNFIVGTPSGIKPENKGDGTVKTNDTLFMNYPPLTDEYILPLDKNITYLRSESQIYENEYVKVDATTGKDGYILITYKDPWASKLWITLDETSVETGLFNKSYHYYFNAQEFTANKPIAIRLPVSDAIYYMSIASTIKGMETFKIMIDLGQITTEGTIPLQEIIPTEEEIVLTNNSGVYSNKFVRIDTTTASEGYIILENLDERAYNLGVYISTEETNEIGTNPGFIWISDSKGKSSIKVPLTYGVTSYNITVVTSMTYEPTGSECSSKKAELTFKPTTVSETGPFLFSAGEVIYDENMMFIKKAKEIASTCSNDFEKVEKMQAWLTSYMTYKQEEDTPNLIYQCDLEKIYNRKTGVCYDYAVILAAMLRSQGIPCKLAIGYYDGVGHVWTEVYVNSDGVHAADNVYLEGKKWSRVEATLSGANGAKEFINESDKYVWTSYN